jgi:hypothetical protein
MITCIVVQKPAEQQHTKISSRNPVFLCGLFSDAILTMLRQLVRGMKNNELEIIWKKATVAPVKVLCRYFPSTDANQQNPSQNIR